MDKTEKRIVLGVIGGSLNKGRWGLIQGLIPKDRFEILTLDPQTERDVEDLIGDAGFLVVGTRRIGRNTIKAARKLRLIQRIGTRCDNIDISEAKKRGIPVISVPLPHLISVAEHSIMMMLALAKRLIEAHKSVVEGGYQALDLKPTLTSQTSVLANWTKLTNLQILYRKTLGIIGLGEIGTAVAKRARCFEMSVLYHSRTRRSKEEKELQVHYRNFEDLLKESDFVVATLPQTGETERMFTRREFSLMKRNAFFINCARGGLVDQKDLYIALKDGLIAGAGIDAFVWEPVDKDNPLLKLDNVVLTPHSAGGSGELLLEGCKAIIQNILNFSTQTR